jgi:hypothetical protein
VGFAPTAPGLLLDRTGRLTSWRRLALGGEGSVQNALPAHTVCNPYPLNHRPGELRKFGVWLRTQIAKETAVGNHAGQKFSEHEPGARKRHVWRFDPAHSGTENEAPSRWLHYRSKQMLNTPTKTQSYAPQIMTHGNDPWVGTKVPKCPNLTLPDEPLPLSDGVLKSLSEAARAMGKDSTARLVSDLLEKIVSDGLYKAVLDEEAAWWSGVCSPPCWWCQTKVNGSDKQ